MLRQPEKGASGHRYPPPAVSSVGRIQLLHQGPRGQLGGGLPALRAVSAHGGDDGGCYFTDEYTAILFAEDLEKITAFYRDSMQMPVVTSWDRGPEDRGCRLRSAGGFTDIRQKTENTPQGPALTTIEAEDVNACFAWLESRDDVEVLLGLTDTWYGDRIFQICDEEKNVVEVLAYRRNMKNRDTLPQEDPS